MNAGFLSGQGHEVALHGGLQGGDAGWALALEIVQEIPDEDAVAPGMTGHPLFAEVEVIDCGLAAKGPMERHPAPPAQSPAFAGNLATGFLFSAQRGQSGVQMSLLDGWMETDELDEAETVPEETGTEEATEPTTEPEAPTETLPVTEPEETMPETEPVTESTEGMTESTEETLEGAAQRSPAGCPRPDRP